MNYEFDDLEIKHGSSTILVSGRAEYEIDDEGIGGYEYWGAKGIDHQYVARFVDATITNYDLQVSQKSSPIQGVTENDISAFESIVVDMLNDNQELCIELAQDDDYMPEEDLPIDPDYLD